VLGPGPPPWENDENYRFLTFFYDFGVFNRAGKSDSKIGIYALPPLKREIYGEFIDILLKIDFIDKLGLKIVPFLTVDRKVFLELFCFFALATGKSFWFFCLVCWRKNIKLCIYRSSVKKGKRPSI
jgi:hypothetical protein